MLSKARQVLYRVINFDRKLKLEPSALVLHMRGGDVFNKSGAVPSTYAQPPLSFYQECIITHSQHHDHKFRVILVFEDKNNPCVNELIRWCADKNVPLSLQHGFLFNDYSYFMKAHALVASHGTFLYPALDLNSNLEIVYSFHFERCRHGKYFKPGEWTCSQDQIEKMLNISAKDLTPCQFVRCFVQNPLHGAKCRKIIFRFISWMETVFDPSRGMVHMVGHQTFYKTSHKKAPCSAHFRIEKFFN